MKNYFLKLFVCLGLILSIFTFDIPETKAQLPAPPMYSSTLPEDQRVTYGEDAITRGAKSLWKSWSDMVTKWDDPISQIARAAGTMAGLGKSIPEAIATAIASSLAGFATSIAKYVLEIIFIPLANVLVTISGKLLNYSIQYTIYESLDASGANPISTFDTSVKEIWTIIRDLFNLSFIFILLFIALKKIIGQAGGKIQGLLLSVIISAIFINFSFFCTRIVIDTGNKIATTIYNQIEIDIEKFEVGKEVSSATYMAGINKKESTVSLSEMMRDALGLKTIYDGGQILSNLNETTAGQSFFRFIIYVITAFVFFSLTFLLMGRYIMLIFLTAASPIGFIFGSLPAISGYTKKWWDELIKQVAIAPVFMFFMLMIIKVSNTESLETLRAVTTDNKGKIVMGVGVYFNYIIIVALMIASLKITKGLSGKMSGFADKAGAIIAGTALAVGTGGAALAGRQLIGRGAAFVANSGAGKFLQQQKAKGSVFANMALKGIKGASNSSFDLRSSKLAQGAMGQMKNVSGGVVDIQGALGSVGALGKASGDYGKGKTGFAGWKDKQTEMVLKQSQEYDKSSKDFEAKLALKAQEQNKVKEKQFEESEAKAKLDSIDSELDIATLPADTNRLTAAKAAAQADYNTKRAIRIDAEKNTAAGIENRSEEIFKSVGVTAADSESKRAYEEAQAKIQRIKMDRGLAAHDAFTGRMTNDAFKAEDTRLQRELSATIKEMDDAKAAGIKEQINVVSKQILDNNNPDDKVLVQIIKGRKMREDYSNQLINKMRGLSKTIMSNKGESKEKSEEEKTLATLLQQIEKLNNKK